VVENQRGGRLGDGGRVCGARAWTDETNDVRGENFWPAGGGSVLKGSGGEGRRGGAPRGGGAGERERGGPWARCGAAWWRGVTAARPRRARATRCRAIVVGGGVGTTRTAWLTGGPGRIRGGGH
jgi:hypothetical protein